METAFEFGRQMALHGVKVIYGGSGMGTMGALANGVLAENGSIVGVFPKGFMGKKENYEKGIRIDRLDLTDLILVKDMAERKATMEFLSDCAIALPGGYGTLDELFEYAVGNEVGRHSKPTYVLNVGGFYDGMRQMIDRMLEQRFVPSDEAIIFVDSVEEFVREVL